MREGSATRRVLLIEDNEDDQFTIGRAVRRFDPEIRLAVAADGEEAITMGRALADAATLPDLVFLDLKLPKVDGLEVLRHLRADDRYDCVPIVVFLTPENPAVRGCHSLGVSSYLRKRLTSTASKMTWASPSAMAYRACLSLGFGRRESGRYQRRHSRLLHGNAEPHRRGLDGGGVVRDEQVLRRSRRLLEGR